MLCRRGFMFHGSELGEIYRNKVDAPLLVFILFLFLLWGGGDELVSYGTGFRETH